MDGGDSSPFFLRLREWGVDQVRLGTRWEYKRRERGFWIKSQAKSVVWRDRGGVDVAGGAGESEEARQRASLFSSVADGAFGFSGGGSRNNVGKLRRIWGGEEAGDGVLEGVQGGEGVGFGGEEVFRDCRHLSR